MADKGEIHLVDLKSHQVGGGLELASAVADKLIDADFVELKGYTKSYLRWLHNVCHKRAEAVFFVNLRQVSSSSKTETPSTE